MKTLGGIYRVGPTCHVIVGIVVIHKIPEVKDELVKINERSVTGLWGELQVMLKAISL